jgi:hypothetical protein
VGPGLGTGRTPYYQNWNRTLDADTLYYLTGLYYVDSTYTLTIPAGTHILGDTAGTLIVSRGAQIFANGTAEDPIVMTSMEPPGSRARGDWGGVIILGEGDCNQTAPLIEGGIIGGTYGGGITNDNSGVFKYVRIEFAGYRFALNNEVNGLTMGAVGSGTELHHVQVSYADDDSYEWFGGDVNAKYLVCFGGTDDEFDTDFGYEGKLQYCFGMKDPETWDPTGQSNGFESDNCGSSSCPAQPETYPKFSNVTLVGPYRHDGVVLNPAHRFEHSAVLRRNTTTSIYNSIIMGYPWGLSIRDPKTISKAINDSLQLHNLTIAAMDTFPACPGTAPDDSCVHACDRWANVCAWFDSIGQNNPYAWQLAAGWNPAGYTATNHWNKPKMSSRVGFMNMMNFNDPQPVPMIGSEGDTANVDFTELYLQDPFFDVVDYRGAFVPGLPMDQQWTAGWTNFDPQNYNVYTAVSDPADAKVVAKKAAINNYPNPFNPTTAISYTVPTTSEVTLKVFNIRGQEVATLVDGEVDAGTHSVTFTTDDLPSGTYFYKLSGDGIDETHKMVLLK